MVDKTKELEELRIKLKKVKGEVYDAEKDLGVSRKDKIVVVKEISTLTRNKEMLTEEVAGLKEKIKRTDEAIIQKGLANTKEDSRLKKEASRLKDAALISTNQALANKEERDRLDKDGMTLKEKEAAFAYKENDYKMKLDKLNTSISTFEVKENGFDCKQKDEKLKLEKDKEEIASNIEKSKQLKIDYANKLKVLEEAIKKSGEEENEYKKLQNTLNSRNLLLDDQAKSLDRRDEVLARKLRGIDREKLAMQVEKDQFQIKKLRVDKIIKEKGIARELEALEKELDTK